MKWNGFIFHYVRIKKLIWCAILCTNTRFPKNIQNPYTYVHTTTTTHFHTLTERKVSLWIQTRTTLSRVANPTAKKGVVFLAFDTITIQLWELQALLFCMSVDVWACVCEWNCLDFTSCKCDIAFKGATLYVCALVYMCVFTILIHGVWQVLMDIEMIIK